MIVIRLEKNFIKIVFFSITRTSTDIIFLKLCYFVVIFKIFVFLQSLKLTVAEKNIFF